MASSPNRLLRRVLAPSLALLAFAMGCQNPVGVDDQPANPNVDLAVTMAGPTTYYVNPAGNDANNGTSTSQPWKTLAKANTQSFGAGDRLLLLGGATFAGGLEFDPQDKGTAANPIVVGSYGFGRATIQSGIGTAISIYNTAGFVIKRLVLQGAGGTTNFGSGIEAYMDLAGTKLDYVTIQNVEASGFGEFGVVVGSWAGTAGFKNVTITQSIARDNAREGFATYSELPDAHQNVALTYLKAFNNTGRPGVSYPTGSGIALGGVAGGRIERSIAHHNGALSDAPGGPIGIWTYDSDGIVIQYNESYANRTGGLADGGGFDLDQNTRNSTLQYNYSHDNDGAGFLLAHAPNNSNHFNNVVRYNISENDARKNSYGSVLVYGRILSAEIYHNTIFTRPSTSGTPSAVLIHNLTIPGNVLKDVHLRNNTFTTQGGLEVVVVKGLVGGPGDLRFEGNNYFAGGTKPKILWKGVTYSGLAAWRTATTQESLNGVSLGSGLDPRFTNAGFGGTIGHADSLANLTAYQLLSDSPLVDRGLNLFQLFGLFTGTIDFYGGSTPANVTYDVGAHEWR